jgi:peptidoglycan/LPS O-acetylase OafA/YrhL
MRRLAALDGLRGIAALMVFLHHVQLPGIHPATLGLDAGVLIFFSLSGYLLYAPFVARQADGRPMELRSYAVRRFLRIAPAYLVAAFAITWIWHPALLQDPIAIASTIRTPIVVVWTLQLEVGFYVLLPVIAFALGRFRSVDRVRILFGAAAASIGLTVLVMIATAASLGYVPGAAISTLGSYAWAFVPGMVVAELERRGRLSVPLPAAALLVGVGLIALSSAVDPPAFLDLPAALGAGAVIAFLVSRPAIAPRLDRFWAAAGALSYSVYLWHEAIIDAVDRPTPTWVGAVLAAAITLGIAGVVYVGIERPAIRLGQRLRPPASPEPRVVLEPTV